MALDPTVKRIGTRLLRALSSQAQRALRDATREQRKRPASRPASSQPRTRVLDTSRGLPPFTYAPERDGDADPGEVCWAWVPYEEDPSQGKDRPVLVLARYNRQLIVAQMTSKDHVHRGAPERDRAGRVWMDIGTGEWDRQRRPSEVRLDRLLIVDPSAIRREGASLDRTMFDSVVRRLHEIHDA
ncbi:type II toxin-antitoxin system PemK/MazF family toxin [Nanchangia anserum]|uniref:Type II toxin-antitoxin system PemK/MazF family toxin n=1 Tax=Nanchangia anserum TaxID=2692125 RepID=A0A8I0KNB5_9ACTO|nr:type II toxin-antitoxin system PemK/MazF family toxin [Nanchangia anserum]MBD3689106.1 type II toxin-antitoxin system PemK/MazF family toxin [Nanchangia anserum]QOX81341.1 type II toxin-antitoxin system PemK/MazF family toxin [Nanchangia anserum]